ncbi:hypothetical protein PMAYCL1PPCAC_25659 [Pristionchus mayeri]|uniref:Uncharacterized protein n=1 Tax=Pristionchus mayeri TaxID=1317129 RepID=A0AAN5D4H2_9BILA|nr:hypothetical protein PMAYCL1PPCAC_25659 [Pristionchus mayeri]
MAVCFKATALISLLFTVPHLYPGLSASLSSALLTFVLFGVLPLALLAINLLIQDKIVENDAIESRVDEYKFTLAVGLLVLRVCESAVELVVGRND